MEQVISIAGDISYKSELILDIEDVKDLIRRRPTGYNLRRPKM